MCPQEQPQRKKINNLWIFEKPLFFSLFKIHKQNPTNAIMQNFSNLISLIFLIKIKFVPNIS